MASVRVFWSGPGSVTVNITTAGSASTNFSIGGTPVTFPYTISTTTKFDTSTLRTYSVSVQYQGTEVATSQGVPLVFECQGEPGASISFAPSAGAVGAPTGAEPVTGLDADVAAKVTSGTATPAALGAAYGGLGNGTRPHGFDVTNAVRQEVLTPVRVAYNPASSSTTYSHTADTLWTDVDATNLTATIIVPPSGKVRIDQTCWVSTSGGAIGRWGVRDSLGDLTESQVQVTNSGSGIRVRSTVVVSKDGSGAALVPGAALTLYWRYQVQNSAQTITMVVGGVGTATPTGSAEMTLTPVSNRLPAKIITPTVTASPTFVPWDVQPDGQHMIGWDDTLSRICYSTNGGSTWTDLPNLATPAGTKSAWYAGDGEILVDAGVSTIPGAIWKSSGWATNPATATFTRVLTANNVSGSNDVYFGTYSGHSNTRGVHVVSEYGPKNSATDMARYVYYSTDYGNTWTTVFDLNPYATANFSPWAGSSAHIHSAVYDPFWDAIWIVTGDWNGSNVLPLTLVCFNWRSSNPTWQLVYNQHQFTGIIPMPECILFVTDEGTSSPDGLYNGIWRLRRQGGFKAGAGTVMEVAYKADTTANQTWVGGWWARHEWVPDAPTIIGIGETITSGPTGRLIATYDGFSFQVLWTATDIGTNGAVEKVMGPINGKITAAYKANADAAAYEVVSLALS